MLHLLHAIAAMLERLQQCWRDCSNVGEIAAMSHLSHAISATTATLQRSHATNETQKICHVALPKCRQSGVSHVQQGGLNLTDNTSEFASTVSLFCYCCCPVVPSNASSYCPSRCPPLYRRTSVATSRRIVNQRLMQ
jgi:hypothetical protein